MLTTMTYRMPNFTLEQKLFLLRRIHAVVDTVQDFRKDTNTTVHRNAVWAELVQAFNAAFPSRPPSSIGSLKTLWKRLKVECRVGLQKRQEQQAAGLPVSALTQVQREVIALVPNLISCLEEVDGDGSYASVRGSSPGAVMGLSGTNGSEHEDADHSQNDEVDSKENLATELGLVSPTHPPVNSGIPPGTASSPLHSHSLSSRSSRPSLIYSTHAGLGSGTRGSNFDTPHRESVVPRAPAGGAVENSLPPMDSYTSNSKWEARRQELFELEHQQTMSLLLLQQCVWEEKRKAVRQKEKAARAKKRYYQAKLRKIGADPPPSSSDSEDNEYLQT
ncbi:fibrinogen silencer-binding protein-like [Sinocyclocheilus anshuiensis]|uniref:fibrinogen silencer-binding protein-like n=1 Tax=Sinocyclocheilus anshuiensis TaxID=1608454 RepID=UPI0007B9CB0E|nr:PREDICTED: fibrinogen silencer-binding protein-like [Sinocyclocheilus anshuiensis]